MRASSRSIAALVAAIVPIGSWCSLSAQAPVFINTPCGAVNFATIGVPISIPITAAANTGQPNEAVVLASGVLPGSSTMTPALPLIANGPNATVTSTFDWTPTTADAGFVAIGFVAVNQLAIETQCSIVFDVIGLPTFDPPTPCGQTLTATVGIPFTFNLQVSCLGNFVSVIDAGLPTGASHNPPLPLQAAVQNPTVSSTFNWTPGNAQVGSHFINYIAFNKSGQATFCSVQILVAECFLILGFQNWNSQIGPSSLDRLLLYPEVALPVSLTSIPSIPIINHPMFHGMHLYAQVGMNNPSVFPNDPIQMTQGLEIILGVGVNPYGYGGSGMNLWNTTAPVLGGTLSFGFSIPGF